MIIRRLDLSTGEEGQEEHVPFPTGWRLVTGNNGMTNRGARWVRGEPGEPVWTAPAPMRARTAAAVPSHDRMFRGAVNR